MTRRLSGLERQFYQQNLVGSTNMVCALTFDQALDSKKLKSALAELLRLNPILASDIVADPYIRFQAPSEPPLPYTEKETSDWRSEFERDLNRQYPGPQIHLHHLKEEGRSHLLLGVNHAVADALSSLVLARDLLDLYSDREVKPLPHGPGIESRFPKLLRGIIGWFLAIRFVFFVLAKKGPALQIGLLNPTQNTRSIGFRFDHMKELNAKAREKGSNFFALFSAVVLKSLHELYAPEQKPLDLSLNTTVSLRPFAGVHKDEIGVFLAGHIELYKIHKDKDPYELARECFEAIKKGVAAGHPFHLTRLARGSRKPKPPKLPTRVSTHRPTVSISNIGRVDELPKAASARVVEIHGASAQSIRDPFAFVLGTYGEDTYVDLQYSVEKITREEATAILEAVRQKLAFLSKNS